MRFKPGPFRPGLGLRFLVEHGNRGQRSRGVLLFPIDHAEHVGRNHGDLTSGLDHARPADQPLAYSRRQQVQFVFRRQRRLPPRCRGRNRGGVVDQEGGDAAVEQAVLLQ